jgi:hypothetical protein
MSGDMEGRNGHIDNVEILCTAGTGVKLAQQTKDDVNALDQ